MRNWGLMRALSHNHELHLLSFGDAPAAALAALASVTTVPHPERGPLDRLRDLVLSAEPDMVSRLRSGPYRRALRDLLDTRSFDVVQVQGLDLIPYALPYLRQPGGPLWVYDAQNVESALQRSALEADLPQPRRWPAALYSAIQVGKLRRFEAARLPAFDLVTAVSEADAAGLRDIAGVEPVVIANGIDTGEVAPGCAAPAGEMQERDAPALVFTGKMDYRPNVDGVLWFVDEILPRIEWEGSPPLLWVVGQQPHRSLERLRGHPQVLLTGYVDQTEPYIAGADVVVVPLRMGSGTRLKVLQALSMARPLVGTPLGCAGLALRDGEHLRLAGNADAFARAISDLLHRPAEGEKIARAAREHVRAHFDWRGIVPHLEAAYEALAAGDAIAAGDVHE
jgi:polysaccharide biosynthesis protein PslH